MDRTIRLLMLAVLIGTCSAGNGYNYIRPAKSVGSVAPVVNKDGSTKSVYFFSDPDDHQNQQRIPQQRSISYKQPASYSRSTTTYNQVASQQRPITYSQAVPQQRSVTYTQSVPQQNSVTYTQSVPQQNSITYSQAVPQQNSVTYSQAVPQQNSVTYNQVVPQQQSIPYNQIAPQQRQFTYNTIAPQQQISYSTNQAQQQNPFLVNQIVSQQNPIVYSQVVAQQQPFVYSQIIPQQVPIYSNQITPQQFQYTNQFGLPVQQELKVIFVRTPGYEAYTEALLKMAKEAIQSKTIVYVLSKEPDVAELTRRFQEIQATARKMPEVRFIKYKTDDEAVQAQQAIQAQYESLPGTSNTIGTPIGTAIGTSIGTGKETATGSINYSNDATSGTSASSLSPSFSSSSSPSLSSKTTRNNEDDLYPQSSPPFLPTGVDVVPGSSYLPPNQVAK